MAFRKKYYKSLSTNLYTNIIDVDFLVEVKCPASLKDKTLIEEIECKKITFIHSENGVPKLKNCNDIYQVQEYIN